MMLNILQVHRKTTHVMNIMKQTWLCSWQGLTKQVLKKNLT